MTAVKRIPVTTTDSLAPLNFAQKIYRDTICINKTRWMGRRAIAKTFTDGKPCTRHNQITRFTHQRVKLQLAFVFPFFPPFPFRLFTVDTVDMSSVGNFSF